MRVPSHADMRGKVSEKRGDLKRGVVLCEGCSHVKIHREGSPPPSPPQKKRDLNREVVLGEGFIHIEIMRERFQKEKKKVVREECQVVLSDGFIHTEI